MSASHSYIMPTYSPQPISFTRGEGSWLYTADDTAYLDALTGIAVCGLGHCHPKITKAIQEQAATLVHTSNLFQIEWQQKAAEALCQAAGMDSVFFANSGAEANEAALKMARLYGYKKGYKKPKVIVMEKSFHGRTLLTVTATANPKAREGFFTLDSDFIRVPFGDIEALKKAAQDNDEITAVLLEPIQGEGGLNTAKDGFDYLEQVQAVCDLQDWLFMLDEVQTGNGRTGKYFAYQHSNAKPDVLSTAKGLGNGFPIGACMVRGRARDLFQVGSHGSTYGGTPLGSRVVHTVYDILTNTDVMQNATTEGDYIQHSLSEALKDLGVTTRGHGMMIGVVLPESTDCSTLVDRAREQEKLIINVTGGHVIRLLPPLNLKREESDQLIERLIRLIKSTLS
ncbi:aspartate aminotransferase family protein [Psychrobacter phenylpyruvicus]|uniref:Acetylornithine aminotransferase n=1 Tax=Psychrobacter phenylpyruvicus TaxID=29432 RepID=A0A379LK40_9GAMM|nr:aspartate aminotransferase family protein [Psychrobacter phenylpyruvicus]SUD90966.1 Acetylornithine aminotransferase [Psychrobacter phenylpyruvicus]